MVNEKFRRQLRQEAKLWQEEQLIDDSLYQQLATRYQFDHLETAASSRFVMILIGLGSILLGLGVITFVAANWQDWSKAVKVILLLSLFIGVNAAGFYLWKQPSDSFQVGRKRRLGEGLLLFGALILGANIALMGQIFHQSGSPYELFLVWGIGVLVMSYSLQLTSLGFLGLLLYGIGYWTGTSNLFSQQEFSILHLVLEHTPLIAGFLFISLAYWCQSRVLFVMTLLILIPALQISIIPLFNSDLPQGLLFAFLFIFTPALLWGYDDTLWPNVDSRCFQPLARTLSIIMLAVLFFSLSFNGFWNNFPSTDSNDLIPISNFVLIDFVFFLGILFLEWFQLVKPTAIHPNKWGFDSITSVIVGFLGLTGLICFWHLQIHTMPEIATFLFNVQMFLLATGLIRIGLAQTQRFAFWGGMILLVSQIMSRTFEYNTELILKAFVFTLCGVGVIVAGLWFERHLLAIAKIQNR
ncbi:hypothetical protein PCC9214_04954 [Planktothrix tepida]|uniref:DUF2157 domain-containing protein n=1 Tax=Planktothrix tepida PCC 9214 TaxID=671072 RepID=A0A1J1LIV2_9CYAN|nr:DUF2157 domain-containing protein [Planktothrix tepida]CAD5982320.1 hypothetical protein PCC9214_04954 [Planktothrix tepida]CUR31954.1 conserved membrane hypothetical protein [Planktothrix tepida PCC 9214]